VVGTNPISGSLVAQGQAITLVVSSGACTVYMPMVVGDSEAAANAALANVGLSAAYSLDPTTVCPAGAPPTVASQTEQPGTAVKYGSVVRLTICQTAAATTSTTTTTTTTTTVP
jgi:serine/threonine-protein kinase